MDNDEIFKKAQLLTEGIAKVRDVDYIDYRGVTYYTNNFGNSMRQYRIYIDNRKLYLIEERSGIPTKPQFVNYSGELKFYNHFHGYIAQLKNGVLQSIEADDSLVQPLCRYF